MFSIVNDFSDLSKAVDKLTPDERLKVAERLSAKKLDDIKAASEKQRLARIEAAMQNETLRPMVQMTLRQLRRLGLDFEKIAAKADVAAVDKAARELPGFTAGEAIELKTALSRSVTASMDAQVAIADIVLAMLTKADSLCEIGQATGADMSSIAEAMGHEITTQ